MITADNQRCTERRHPMILKGQHGTYQRGKKIGGGGNGSVYQVSCQPPTQKECVVKILHRGGQKSYQRFKYEIKAMKELSGKYESFLPILDEYLPDELKGENPPWYLMPRAIPLMDYVFGKNMLVTQKMMIAKELAIALADIHREGYSHRDIKPENILYYKNRLVVSDFGLVSHSKFERVTGHKERIGPWNTIAPEMRRFPDQIADARPADVYSFAKTIWILLMEDIYCFDGQYSKEKTFGLKCDYFKVESLENIHQFMMEATEELAPNRPSIEDVIDYIDRWFATISDEQELVKEKRAVTQQDIRNRHVPTVAIYNNVDQMFDIIRKLIDVYMLSSDQFTSLKARACMQSVIPDCLEISDGTSTYIFRPVQLILNNNNGQAHYTLEIADIPDEAIAHSGEELVRKENFTLLDMVGRSLEKEPAKLVLAAEKEITFHA